MLTDNERTRRFNGTKSVTINSKEQARGPVNAPVCLGLCRRRRRRRSLPASSPPPSRRVASRECPPLPRMAKQRVPYRYMGNSLTFPRNSTTATGTSPRKSRSILGIPHHSPPLQRVGVLRALLQSLLSLLPSLLSPPHSPARFFFPSLLDATAFRQGEPGRPAPEANAPQTAAKMWLCLD